jgi:hypothetical protein
MTVIKIKAHRWGWKAFEAPGVELCFQRKFRQSTTRGTAHALSRFFEENFDRQFP